MNKLNDLKARGFMLEGTTYVRLDDVMKLIKKFDDEISSLKNTPKVCLKDTEGNIADWKQSP